MLAHKDRNVHVSSASGHGRDRTMDRQISGVHPKHTCAEVIVRSGSIVGGDSILVGEGRTLSHRVQVIRRSTSQGYQKPTWREDIVSKEKYKAAAKSIKSWLTICKSNLDQMLREPIAAEPAEVQNQINRLKTFSDDVNKLRGGVKLVDRTGAALREVMPAMTLHVNITKTKVHKRYNDLRGKIAKHLSTLQSALSRSKNNQCKPLQHEVASYQPTKEELSKIGMRLKTAVTRGPKLPARTTSHQRSSQLVTANSGDNIVLQQMKDMHEEASAKNKTEGDMGQQLRDAFDFQDKTDVSHQHLAGHHGDVEVHRDWCVSTDSKPLQHVASYQPTEEEFLKIGMRLKTVTQEPKSPARTTFHQRSPQVVTANSGDDIVLQQVKDMSEQTSDKNQTEGDIGQQLRPHVFDLVIKNKQGNTEISRHLRAGYHSEVEAHRDWCISTSSKEFPVKVTKIPVVLETTVVSEKIGQKNAQCLDSEQKETLLHRTEEILSCPENEVVTTGSESKSKTYNPERNQTEEGQEERKEPMVPFSKNEYDCSIPSSPGSSDSHWFPSTIMSFFLRFQGQEKQKETMTQNSKNQSNCSVQCSPGSSDGSWLPTKILSSLLSRFKCQENPKETVTPSVEPLPKFSVSSSPGLSASHWRAPVVLSKMFPGWQRQERQSEAVTPPPQPLPYFSAPSIPGLTTRIPWSQPKTSSTFLSTRQHELEGTHYQESSENQLHANQKDSTRSKNVIGQDSATESASPRTHHRRKVVLLEKAKKKRKQLTSNIFATLLIFLATVSSASASNHHNVTLGSPGRVTFDAPWTSRDGLFPYYTIRFESKRQPFCTMVQLHPNGFKSQHQYERFKISYTLTDNIVHVAVNILDVSSEDAGVYILTVTPFGGESDSTIQVVKEIKICQTLGKAQCGILEASEGYSKMYADVDCRARVGNENSTLACYQHGTKIPYKGGINNDGHQVHGRFWMNINKSPVYCCSHDLNSQTDQSTCNDFVWPRPTKPPTTMNTLATMPGQALSVSTYKNAREFPGETYNSSCDLHAKISFLYLLLGISLFVVMQ